MASASAAIASTVFTALNGSIGSANTIIGWAGRLESFSLQYAEAGETIRDIQRNALACKEELEQWRDYWDIKAATKYAYQRELWGDAKVRDITAKISTIEDLCSRFDDELRQFFKGTSTSQMLQTIAQQNSSISSTRALASFRKDAEDTIKDASRLKIALFINNLLPQATIWLARLKAILAELWDIAEEAYFAKHGEKVSDRLTLEQMEKIKRSTFLRMAVEIRSPSEELFRSCLIAKTSISQQNAAARTKKACTRLKIDLTGIKSGVDLENMSSQSGIQLLLAHLYLVVALLQMLNFAK